MPQKTSTVPDEKMKSVLDAIRVHIKKIWPSAPAPWGELTFRNGGQAATFAASYYSWGFNDNMGLKDLLENVKTLEYKRAMLNKGFTFKEGQEIWQVLPEPEDWVYATSVVKGRELKFAPEKVLSVLKGVKGEFEGLTVAYGPLHYTLVLKS